MVQLPILVVDDNEFIRASMIKFLETNNYEVFGVGHAQDAMDALRAQEFGIVITDVLMPDTDGFELVDFIRGYTEPMKSTPIIAISGGGRTIDDGFINVERGLVLFPGWNESNRISQIILDLWGNGVLQ